MAICSAPLPFDEEDSNDEFNGHLENGWLTCCSCVLFWLPLICQVQRGKDELQNNKVREQKKEHHRLSHFSILCCSFFLANLHHHHSLTAKWIHSSYFFIFPTFGITYGHFVFSLPLFWSQYLLQSATKGIVEEHLQKSRKR